MRRGTRLDGWEGDAFLEQVDRPGEGALLVLIRRIVGRPELAEEIVQEAYVRLAEQPPGSVRIPQAWLRTVATRLALNQRRRARFAATIEIETAQEIDAPDESTRPERFALKREFDEQLAAAIHKLRPEQIELVNLLYYQGVSAREIASRWQISEAAVMHRVYRALVRIRQYLRTVGIDGAGLE